MAQTFCVPTRRFQRVLQGIETDFIFSGYTDRVLIVATQIGTVGTVLHASPEVSMEGNATFTVSTMFGRRDQDELVVCARRIVEGATKGGCTRPLIICLGLKSPSIATVKAVVETVLEQPIW